MLNHLERFPFMTSMRRNVSTLRFLRFITETNLKRD